jgi:lipopolysaccharide/colanic/teichoic acid biosynthesis glycosyltransferase
MKRDSFAGAVVPEHRRSLRRFGIRCGDVAMAAMCLVLLAPLLVLVIVTMKISLPGPLVVSQWRYGYRNRLISIRRFRTTYAIGENEAELTFIEHFLMLTGFEDLPMLENVFRGEMSIFGPEPSIHPQIALNDRKPGLIRWATLLYSGA